MIWAILSLALGGVLKGATGAGVPVVAVPALAMVYSVDFAVTTLIMSNLVNNLWQGWAYRRDALPRRFVWHFAGGGMLGAGAGTWLLANLPGAALSLTVAVAVYLYIGFRLLRPDWAVPLATGRRLAAPVGVAGGLMQGAAGISAPVSITFLNALSLSRGCFMGTISVFFVAMTVVQIPALIMVGLLDWERFWISCGALVIASAFMPAGSWLGARISKRVFDRVVLVLLGLIATRIIVMALWSGAG